MIVSRTDRIGAVDLRVQTREHGPDWLDWVHAINAYVDFYQAHYGTMIVTA